MSKTQRALHLLTDNTTTNMHVDANSVRKLYVGDCQDYRKCLCCNYIRDF